MNDVRFHCLGESVAAMVCACDVYKPTLWWGYRGPLSTVLPQESASAHHDKMYGGRIVWTWRRTWQLSMLVVGGMHIKELMSLWPLLRHEQIFLLAA